MDQQQHQSNAKPDPNRNPLLKKLSRLQDFEPDHNAIDEATAFRDEASLAALKRKLGVK